MEFDKLLEVYQNYYPEKLNENITNKIFIYTNAMLIYRDFHLSDDSVRQHYFSILNIFSHLSRI
jgi:hypothetical protein